MHLIIKVAVTHFSRRLHCGEACGARHPTRSRHAFEVRFETPPGEQAQVDLAWFEVEFTDEPGGNAAHASDARTDKGLVADEPQREADQDRPRPLRRLPDGRGRDSEKPLRRHPAVDRGTAATAGHVNSVTSSICHAFHENPRETCVSMTENLAISAFGLTLVRPDTLRKHVDGGPRLLGTPTSRSLGLNRRPYGECRLM